MTKVETPLVLRTDDGPVRTLTLNRGERFSPLSSAMIAVLQAELDAVAADESILRRLLGDPSFRQRCAQLAPAAAATTGIIDAVDLMEANWSARQRAIACET